MRKPPPDSPSGFYHVAIPFDALEDESFDEDMVIYRPISEAQAQSLAKLFNAVGRNRPCPCGSGIKYKKCCLQKAH